MNDLVIVKKDKAVCDSLMVAEKFGKRHQEVIYAIEGRKCTCGGSGCKKCSGRGYQQLGILQDGLEISTKSHLSKMFWKSSYKDAGGRTRPLYYMDRDGFTLLGMGFTGRDALDWKVKYIGAFKHMEHLLMERQTSEWQALRAQSKETRKVETNIIQQFIDYAKNKGSRNAWHYYTSLTNLVNKAAGITTRNLATVTQLNTVMFLDRMIGDVLKQGMSQGMEYKDIYDLCKGKVLAIKELALLDMAA